MTYKFGSIIIRIGVRKGFSSNKSLILNIRYVIIPPRIREEVGIRNRPKRSLNIKIRIPIKSKTDKKIIFKCGNHWERCIYIVHIKIIYLDV